MIKVYYVHVSKYHNEIYYFVQLIYTAKRNRRNHGKEDNRSKMGYYTKALVSVLMEKHPQTDSPCMTNLTAGDPLPSICKR